MKMGRETHVEKNGETLGRETWRRKMQGEQSHSCFYTEDKPAAEAGGRHTRCQPGLNLPPRWRTCAIPCGRSRWGSQRWRSKASGRVCRKSESTGPPLWSSSEGEQGFTRHSNTLLLLLFRLQGTTYSTQIPWARCGVQTEEKPRDGDHVVLHKRLSNIKRENVPRSWVMLSQEGHKDPETIWLNTSVVQMLFI